MPRDARAPGARIAFFGSVGLASKELRAILDQRAFLVRDVRLFDESGEGVLSEFGGEALVVTRPGEGPVEGLDIAFLCGAASEMEPYMDWAARDGFAAIDLSGAASRREGVPVVHAEINPEAIRPPLIAAPHAISHNLATVASVARQMSPLVSLDAVSITPVSELGEPAIDELYQQAVGLLSFGEVPVTVLERQVAFNLVPARGLEAHGIRGCEDRAREETERLLGLPPGSVFVQAALGSVFHGHMTHVTMQFEGPLDPAALAAAFDAGRSTRMVDDLAEFSPVGLAGEDRVAVGGLRPHPRHPERISCWIFCDNLKGGAALNAARIAERLADRVLEAAP